MRFLGLGLAALLSVSQLYPQLQVGFAEFTADDTSVSPFANAILRYTNEQGILIWQVGIEATPPLDAGCLFVDQRQGKRTGLALVNASDRPTSVLFQLRDSSGELRWETDRRFQAFEHFALFVDELFGSGSENFTGSLTFASREGTGRFVGVALREATNAYGESVFATIPIAEVGGTISLQHLVLPQIGAGADLSTELLLINPEERESSGWIRFFSSSGLPLEFEVAGGWTWEVAFKIQGLGTLHLLVERSGELGVGFAVVTPQEGSNTPLGSVLFQYLQKGRIASEAGITGPSATTAARIHVDNMGVRTGVAIASPGNPASTVVFDLMDSDGVLLARSQRMLPPQGHLAVFSDELFPDLPPGFVGVMDIHSGLPFVPVALRLSVNRRGSPIVTSLPVADLSHPPDSSPLFVPQLVLGNGLSTQFLVLSPGSSDGVSGILNFRGSDGGELVIPLEGESDSRFSFRAAPRGAAALKPGPSVSVRGRLLDAVTGMPVPGSIVSTNFPPIGALSDSNGDFTIDVGTAGNGELSPPLLLRICATGYREVERIVEAFEPEANLELFLTPAEDTTCRGSPRVEISSANIPEDRIQIQLGPVGVGGRLQVETVGPVLSHEILSQDRFSGPHFESFDRLRLPTAQFTSLRATWQVGGSSSSVDFAYPFRVLGDYLHTRYNIPNEEECTGELAPFCFNEGDCTFTECSWQTDGMGKSGWLSEARENGSGFSSTVGLVSLEWFCKPPQECQTLFRDLFQDSVCPACAGASLVKNSSVAVRADHPDLVCGDRVFIEGLGVRTVADHGQLPGQEQLDHFSGVSGCNVPASIGRRLTIKLP